MNITKKKVEDILKNNMRMIFLVVVVVLLLIIVFNMFGKKISIKYSDRKIVLTNKDILNDSDVDKIYNIKIGNKKDKNIVYKLEIDSKKYKDLDLSKVKYMIKTDDNSWSRVMNLADSNVIYSGMLNAKDKDIIQVKVWLEYGLKFEEKDFKYKGVFKIKNVLEDETGDINRGVIEIKLKGEEKVNLIKGEPYSEMGIDRATDSILGELSIGKISIDYDYYDGIEIKKVSHIDTSLKGVYFVNYKISNKYGDIGKKTRIVTVNETLEDRPVISLLGDKVNYLDKGSIFTDSSVTVNKIDKLSISPVENIGYVNEFVSGNYVIKYYTKSSNGNFDGEVREVIVNNASNVYRYNGSYQKFKAPVTGYYRILASGAQGGSYKEVTGGLGGYSKGVIKLKKGEELYIYVGSQPVVSDEARYSSGGYNGGGSSTNTDSGYTRGGGGATDIRYFGKQKVNENDLGWNSTNGLMARIMVAGGGGGAYYVSSKRQFKGGSAGGLVGESNSIVSTGGSQVTYGTTKDQNNNLIAGFGIGGGVKNTEINNENPGGAGGSGYYGGSMGSQESGTGGSSYISGMAGVNSVSESKKLAITNKIMHYSSKYFIDTEMIAGVNKGDGKVIITFMGKSYEKNNTYLKNVRYIMNCVNGNNKTNKNAWVEIQAIKDGVNVALNKKISGIEEGEIKKLSIITDGDILANNYTWGLTDTGEQCVVVDLEDVYYLDEISVWHDWYDGKTYKDNILKVSYDNKSWNELKIDNYKEDSIGYRISAWSK